MAACRLRSTGDDIDDLVGVGIDDDDLVIGDEVAIAAILRNKGEHRSWQRCKAHRSRHARANVDREIHMLNAVDFPLLENGLVDVGSLLLRELHPASRCFLGAGLRPGAALGSLLPVFRLRTALGSLLLGFCPRTALGSLFLGLGLSCTLAVVSGLRLRTLRAVFTRLGPVAALCARLR